jgi:hypothetical protein
LLGWGRTRRPHALEQLVDRASYDTARIFAGLGFGSSTASRSIISRPRRTGLCSGSMQV